MAAARKVSAAQRSTDVFCARYQAASLPLVVVLPVPLTPTRKVTLGGAEGLATGRIGASRIPRSCVFQQVAQFFAAFDRLLAGAFAESLEDLGRGLHADVAHDERGFEFFEGRLVDFAGESDDVVDARGKGLAGARDGLAHAREKAGFLGVDSSSPACASWSFFLSFGSSS